MKKKQKKICLSSLCFNENSKEILVRFEDERKFYKVYFLTCDLDKDTLILKVSNTYYTRNIHEDEFQDMLLKIDEWNILNNELSQKIRNYFNSIGWKYVKTCINQ